jgi:hypothetical protein
MMMLSREQRGFMGAFPQARFATLDLRPMQGHWGRWLPEERAIALSEKLLGQTRWLPVAGILGHEIAHQLVSDIYPLAAAHEPPHGPTFIKVCRRMGLDPFYWRASMTSSGLDSAAPPVPLGPDGEDSELKPILDKVKKLLALAGSDNSNESAAALSAAERILARHSLDRNAAMAAANEEGFRRIRFPLGGRATMRHSLIAGILSDFFGVKGVYTWNYDPSTATDTKELELLGRPMNLAMAEYVWAFLNERCDTLWEAFRPRAKSLGEGGLSARNAFVNNLLKAFSKKMAEGRRQAEASGAPAGPWPAGASGPAGARQESVELIRASEARALDEHFREIYPRLRSTRHYSSSASASPNAAGAGAAAGRALSIHPPVKGGGNGGGTAGRIG